MNWTKHRINSVFPTTVHRLRDESGSLVCKVTLSGVQDDAGWTVERSRSETTHSHMTPKSETERHPMFSSLDDAKLYAELVSLEGMHPITPDTQRKPLRNSTKKKRLPDDTGADTLHRCSCGGAVHVTEDPIPSECGSCGRKYASSGHCVKSPVA
jgi:hypothetical protein